MIEALRADGPHSQLAPKLQMFGQFVGSWDVEIINYKPEGSREVVQGEWHFDWVLEGRAKERLKDSRIGGGAGLASIETNDRHVFGLYFTLPRGKEQLAMTLLYTRVK